MKHLTKGTTNYAKNTTKYSMVKDSETITLKGLPKVSFNQLYAGKHWSYRKTIKDQYHTIIKSQCKKVFTKTAAYTCTYEFTFQSRPLDASNCAAMIKMIEDIIFEDDKYDLIKIGGITSKKGKTDSVTIKIEQWNYKKQ